MGTIADHPQLAATTHVGAVSLTVRDLARAMAFYRDALGLEPVTGDEGEVRLHAGDRTLIVLRGDPAAPPQDPRAPGLFHLAIRLPDRLELAQALVRVTRARVPLHGASDHLVSEALYLADPEGNGIELYRDRPRADWPTEHGALRMATLPLDLDDLLGELNGATDVPVRAPAGTDMGHVHLQVTDLAAAEAFWSGIVGFDVSVRGYPGALFVSAGGYHHHIGLNTWHSAGCPPAPPGAAGLRWFEIVLPDPEARNALLERARGASATVEETGGTPLIRDPDGIVARLRVELVRTPAAGLSQI